MQVLNILFSLLIFFSFGQTAEMPIEPVMPDEPLSMPSPPMIAPNSLPPPTQEAEPIPNITGPIQNIDKAVVAQCLTEKGAKVYGAYWCPHCNDQKEMFGDTFKYITYIECAEGGENAAPQSCTDADITAYPTWIFADGQRLVGVHSIEKLAKTAGCQ